MLILSTPFMDRPSSGSFLLTATFRTVIIILPNSSSHSPFHSSASVTEFINGPFPTLFGCGPRDRWDDALQSLVSQLHICHHLGALSLFRSLSPPFTAHLLTCSPRSFNQPYFSHLFGLFCSPQSSSGNSFVATCNLHLFRTRLI